MSEQVGEIYVNWHKGPPKPAKQIRQGKLHRWINLGKKLMGSRETEISLLYKIWI